MDYDHDAHSKYLLMYHMMFVCKYRKQLLSTFGDEIKSIFTTIAEKSEFSNLEMGLDKDHIHILVKSVPKISTLQIVRRLNKYPRIKYGKAILSNSSDNFGKNILSGVTAILSAPL